jgi:hypothetical protein
MRELAHELERTIPLPAVRRALGRASQRSARRLTAVCEHVNADPLSVLYEVANDNREGKAAG